MAEITGTGGNDTLVGTADSDTITALGGDDLVNAGDGNDTVDGGDGNDTLNGQAGIDTLNGGAGDDYVSIQGDDIADGGTGQDRAAFDFLGMSPITLDLSAMWTGGTVALPGGGSVRGFERIGNFYATDGDDVLVLGTGYTDDGVFQGSPEIRGFGGNDSITGGGGQDYFSGEAGNDSLYGLGNDDDLYGGNGDDLLEGGDGDDYLYAGSGNDTGYGGSGTDYAFGDEGNDTFYGGADNDILVGEAGDDSLYGGDGHDNLIGGTGFDRLYGEAGDDSFALTGPAIVDGGTGSDSISLNLASATAGSSLDLTPLWSGGTIAFGAGSIAGIEAINSYSGTGFDDVLIVGDGNSASIYVYPTAGNDRIIAGSGDDRIYMGGGDDVVDGRAGNEEILGGAGNDMLDGGSDNDRIFGGDGNDLLRGGSGDDNLGTPAFFYHVGLENGDDRLEGGTGNDLLYDTVGANLLFGGDGNDRIFGRGELFGEGGDDEMGSLGNGDVVDGGEGNDILYALYNGSILRGGAGNDIFNSVGSLTGAVTVLGGDGIDTIRPTTTLEDPGAGLMIDLTAVWTGGTGTVQIGNGPVSTVTGIELVELYTGTVRSDTILLGSGYTGNLTINFAFQYAGGDDFVIAGDGTDSITFGDGTDIGFGGLGNDNLQGNGGNDALFGDGGNDRLEGGAGFDKVDGGDGDDEVYGGADSDSVRGGDGNDRLFGGDGDDMLQGGAGRDELWGDAGADKFRFREGDSGATIATADIILGFSSAQGDRILLGAIDAVAGGADDAFTFIGTAQFTGVAGQLRYRPDGNAYVEADVDGDGIADFMITVANTPVLTAADFGL